MNTGGPAFPHHETTSTGEPFHDHLGMTLLDWMAGQALAGLCANPEYAGVGGLTECAYDHAQSMLAEKARREAGHSGDANKMVPDPFAETTLRRLAGDVLPADTEDAADEQTLVWCAEQARARVNTLEAINRELVEALEAIVSITDRDHVWWHKARATLAKAKGVA